MFIFLLKRGDRPLASPVIENIVQNSARRSNAILPYLRRTLVLSAQSVHMANQLQPTLSVDDFVQHVLPLRVNRLNERGAQHCICLLPGDLTLCMANINIIITRCGVNYLHACTRVSEWVWRLGAEWWRHHTTRSRGSTFCEWESVAKSVKRSGFWGSVITHKLPCGDSEV